MIAMNKALLISLCLAGSSAYSSQDIVIGSTTTIAETSVLDEIEESAARANWQEALNTEPSTWGGFQSGRLPIAKKNVVRQHKPYYTLDTDIKDQMGQVIYPKGFTFNPMAYVRLPSRIFIVGDKPVYKDWLLEHAEAFDMVLTAGGDPMALGAKYGRPIFILEPKMRDRLGVKVVPSIISQQGDALQIKEMVLEQTDPTDIEQRRAQHAG